MSQPLGKVGGDWSDHPCFIIGGGPSLKPWISEIGSDYLQALGYVIAVNDSYKHCDPDVIITLDTVWLEKNHDLIPSMPAIVYAAVEEDHKRPECSFITYLKRKNRDPNALLSTDPCEITNGLNSGYGALNLAFLKGCKEIYLLGFDFKPGEDKQTHYHEGYKWHNGPVTMRLYPRWAKIFDECVNQLKEANVEVYNCSENSLLTAFPYKPYKEIFDLH